MKKVIPLLFLLSLCTAALALKAGEEKSVLVLSVDGVINPVSTEYIEKGIHRANRANMDAVLIELDTPGGLDTSMRSIIKAINLSEIPVIVYVYPSGARAASAGVFITLAAHIGAMAPGTNIGAAHPVGMGGGKMDETMQEKVTNDAVAYIRSIAEKRGRNVKWAEDAVRKSVSVSDNEALSLKIIDLIAASPHELLDRVDGRKVSVASGEKTLHTKNATVVNDEMGLRLKILALISDPNIAYILMLLGFYGLFFELTNPGAIFPGVLGGICLILAFYSFQTLPVNYAGVLLIILGIIMFILEIKIVSYGVLTIGGIISMVIGSIMLFETPGPFIRLSLYVILPAALFTALFFFVTIRLAFKAWKSKPVTGQEGLIGLEGIALTDISQEGMVLVNGEYWKARTDEPVKKGDVVVIESVKGLMIKIKKKHQ